MKKLAVFLSFLAMFLVFSADIYAESPLVLSSDGNVGIGTRYPVSKLEISDDNKQVVYLSSGYGDSQVDSSPTFIGRKARGTSLKPTAVLDGDLLAYFGGKGYDGMEWDLLSNAGIAIWATEDHDMTSKGTSMSFLTTPNGSTGKSTGMVISHDGNVGIGRGSPTSRIHIKGSGTNKAKLKIESIEGDHPSVNFLDYETQIGVVGWYRTEDAMKFLYATTLASANGITLKSNGNVGIGTASPSEKLEVDGYVLADGFKTGDIIFRKDGKPVWRMYEDEKGLYVQSLTTEKKYAFALEEISYAGGVAKVTANGVSDKIQQLQEENKALEARLAKLEALLKAPQ